MAIRFPNLPGVDLEYIDRQLTPATERATGDYILVIGTAEKGPVEQETFVDDLAQVSLIFGENSALTKAALEIARGSTRLVLYRVAGESAKIEGLIGPNNIIQASNNESDTFSKYKMFAGVITPDGYTVINIYDESNNPVYSSNPQALTGSTDFAVIDNELKWGYDLDKTQLRYRIGFNNQPVVLNNINNAVYEDIEIKFDGELFAATKTLDFGDKIDYITTNPTPNQDYYAYNINVNSQAQQSGWSITPQDAPELFVRDHKNFNAGFVKQPYSGTVAADSAYTFTERTGGSLDQPSQITVDTTGNGFYKVAQLRSKTSNPLASGTTSIQLNNPLQAGTVASDINIWVNGTKLTPTVDYTLTLAAAPALSTIDFVSRVLGINDILRIEYVADSILDNIVAGNVKNWLVNKYVTDNDGILNLQVNNVLNSSVKVFVNSTEITAFDLQNNIFVQVGTNNYAVNLTSLGLTSNDVVKAHFIYYNNTGEMLYGTVVYDGNTSLATYDLDSQKSPYVRGFTVPAAVDSATLDGLAFTGYTGLTATFSPVLDGTGKVLATTASYGAAGEVLLDYKVKYSTQIDLLQIVN